MSEVRFYGIRHHGPGSARRLKIALEQYVPDILLIELPSDAQSLINVFDPQELEPPVSILIYDPKSFNRASYFPLAKFSPEWQALLYGFKNRIPTQCIDVPMGETFKRKFEDRKRTDSPFQLMADQTKFGDVEQWWDHFLENNQSSEELFEAIHQLIETLRDGTSINKENLWREEFMRYKIRASVIKGYKKLAVIAGAFHIPALQDYEVVASSSIAKGKPTHTKSIWVPWSYERLTRESGYGAGVRYPLWYEALFNHQDEAVEYWMARTIFTLRKKNQNISSAHSVEALRLAEALRRLRRKNKIGIHELEEALTTVVFQGHPQWLEKYEKDIHTGPLKGRILNDSYTTPLQKDFRNKIKKARITKVLEEQKKIQKTLDLRKEIHRSHSHFFFQVSLLNIPLATAQENKLSALGTFKEIWDIEWDSVSEWTLVQAGTYGTTVASAARNKLQQRIENADDMESLVGFIKNSFLCGFDDLFELLQQRMIRVYHQTESVIPLLETLETLIFVDQYGHVRWERPPEVRPLIERIGIRSAQVLPDAIIGIDEETDELLQLRLKQLYYAVSKPGFNHIRQVFSNAWNRILTQNNLTDFYHGFALRRLMDQGGNKNSFIENQFIRHFSDPKPENILEWLNGLISGNILWIVYDKQFLSRLNTWVGNMDDALFQRNLPVLRKIFTESGPQDREKLFHIIRNPDDENKENPKAEYPEEINKYISELVELFGN